jgi:hypothetical protein
VIDVKPVVFARAFYFLLLARRPVNLFRQAWGAKPTVLRQLYLIAQSSESRQDWVNTASGIYHYQGAPLVRELSKEKYMSEA